MILDFSMQHAGDVIMAMPAITSLRRSGIPVSVVLGQQYRTLLTPFNLEYTSSIYNSINMETKYIHMQVTEFWLDKFGVEPARHHIHTDITESVYVISPDSTMADKRMPVEFWKNVVDAMDGPVVMIGPPNAVGYNSKLNEVLGVTDLTGKQTIQETCAMLRHAHAVVTTDTGMSHLSDAINPVTITAFAKDNYHKFKPYWTPRVALNASAAIQHLKELNIRIDK